ncbi:MAG: adenosine kinase [Acidobacteriota bacterium]
MSKHWFDGDLRERGLDIVGIENALLDLLVRAEDSVIDQLGLSKGTMKLVDREEQAAILETVGDLSPEVQSGGSCANVLRNVARLGSRASYSSAVGSDAYGDAFTGDLGDHAVRNRCAVLDTGATGTSVILVSPDGERTMNTHLGACRDYSPPHVPHEDIKDCRIFFTTAYIWDTPNQIEAIEAALATARGAGCKIALDLADPFAVDRSRDTIHALLDQGLDLVFANADEARIMTGMEPREAVRALAEKVDVAAVKIGADGALISSGDTTIEIDAHPVDVVDTTGAGDCFAAGFLHGMIRDLPLETCGHIAAALAADTITHMGVRLSDGIEDRVRELEND